MPDSNPVTGPRRTSRRTFLTTLALALPILTQAHRAMATLVREYSPYSPLDFLSSELTLMPRIRWNPIGSASLQGLKSSRPYDRVTIHHMGTTAIFHHKPEDVIQDINNIMLAHQERHFGDIGYHFIIDYTGRVWEGRPLAFEGAHVYGANQGNVGIMLIGNFEKQQPSLPQLTSLEELTRLLCSHFTINNAHVFGHCDLGPTLCPGRNLYPYVQQIRTG